MGTHVFVSYSHLDRAYVQKLAAYLTAAGLAVWYDYEVEAGEVFGARIQAAIDERFAFVPVLTPASMESQWVHREIAYAVSLNRPVLPLLFAPCTKPIEINNLHDEDVSDGRMPTPRWLKALRRHTNTTAASGAVNPADARLTPADRPYRFEGQDYYFPRELIAAFGRSWRAALAIVGRDESAQLLTTWLQDDVPNSYVPRNLLDCPSRAERLAP